MLLFEKSFSSNEIFSQLSSTGNTLIISILLPANVPVYLINSTLHTAVQEIIQQQ